MSQPDQCVTIFIRYERNSTANPRPQVLHVTTHRQRLDAELEQLRGAGCEKAYRETATGAHGHRRELLKMLDALAPGEVATVTRIDRLARPRDDSR